MRQCEKNEWCPATWADGGAVVDLDAHKVLFFGDSLMFGMNERRALMHVLATVWPGYEIHWAYDGPKNSHDTWVSNYPTTPGAGNRI